MEMSGEVLITSISDHITVMSQLVSLIFGFNLVTLFTILTGGDKVEFGPLKVDRKHAALILMFTNIALMSATGVTFYRLGGLLGALPKNGDLAIQALTTLASHSWLLNPFAYFGNQPITDVVPIDFVNLGRYLSIIGFWFVVESPVLVVVPMIMDHKDTQIKLFWRFLLAFLLLVVSGFLFLGYFYVMSTLQYYFDNTLLPGYTEDVGWKLLSLIVIAGLTVTLLFVVEFFHRSNPGRSGAK